MRNPSIAGLLKSVHLSTDAGDVDMDPMADPEGYRRLLGESADRRTRLQREASDAQQGPASVMNAFSRGQQDMANGPVGYNRGWVPFFEEQSVLADNTGKNMRMDVGSLATPPFSSLRGLKGALKGRR
jgi:hypothetical protein